jgi:hypothetical protein
MNVTASEQIRVCRFHIATLQLSTALLSKASGGMIKRYITTYAALSGLVNQVKAQTNDTTDEFEAAELRGLLEDVALDLGNLR